MLLPVFLMLFLSYLSGRKYCIMVCCAHPFVILFSDFTLVVWNWTGWVFTPQKSINAPNLGFIYSSVDCPIMEKMIILYIKPKKKNHVYSCYIVNNTKIKEISLQYSKTIIKFIQVTRVIDEWVKFQHISLLFHFHLSHSPQWK